MTFDVRTAFPLHDNLATNIGTASIAIPTTGFGGAADFVVPGDIALVALGSNTAVGTFSTPTGWSAIGPPVVSSSAYVTQLFGKKLVAGDIGATHTSTIAPTGRLHGVCIIISGAADVPTVFANTPDTTAGATIAAPNVTTVSAGNWIINFGMIRSATTGGPITVTVDAAGTESAEGNTNFVAGTIPNFAAVAARRNTITGAAGSYGAATFTSSDAGSTGQGWTVALEPAPAVPAPDSAFTASTTSGEAPLTIDFTDTSTGSPTSWAWNFGDGTTSTAQNPSKTYSTPGTYAVTLTASNSGGADASPALSSVTITAPPAGVVGMISYVNVAGTHKQITSIKQNISGAHV